MFSTKKKEKTGYLPSFHHHTLPGLAQKAQEHGGFPTPLHFGAGQPSPALGDAWRAIAGLQQALLAALPCFPRRPCRGGSQAGGHPLSAPSPSALNHEQKGDLQHQHLQQVLRVARSETALVVELSAKPNPSRIRPQCGYPLGPRPTKCDRPQNKRNKRTILSTFATVTLSAHPVVFRYHSSHRHEIIPFPSTVTHK